MVDKERESDQTEQDPVEVDINEMDYDYHREDEPDDRYIPDEED